MSKRETSQDTGEPTGYWFMNVGDDGGSNAFRSWDDCRRYGFMLAGGGRTWSDQVRRVPAGAMLFAYASGSGFVGLGEVLSAAVPQKDFVPPEQTKRLIELPTRARTSPNVNDDQLCDWCIGVRWMHTVDRADGVLLNRARRGTCHRICKRALVAELLDHFDSSRETP